MKKTGSLNIQVYLTLYLVKPGMRYHVLKFHQEERMIQNEDLLKASRNEMQHVTVVSPGKKKGLGKGDIFGYDTTRSIWFLRNH